MRGHFWPLTEVQNGNQREVMRKMQKPEEPRIRLRQGYGVTGYADVTDVVKKRLNSMGASPTHTEDTALQTPVRFRSGQVVCYQSFARAQGGTREFASQVPTSTLPANITSYGRGAGVGRDLGVWLGLGVGVGLAVGVGVAVGVVLGVGVAVAVAVGVADGEG